MLIASGTCGVKCESGRKCQLQFGRFDHTDIQREHRERGRCAECGPGKPVDGRNGDRAFRGGG